MASVRPYNTMWFSMFTSWVVLSLLIATANAFVIRHSNPSRSLSPETPRQRLALPSPLKTSQSKTILAAIPKLSSAQQTRRKQMLGRSGSFFNVNRFNGSVEFGSSAKLVTVLEKDAKQANDPKEIDEWLMDGRGLALSIWDEDLLKDLGNSAYRLQTMKLQFVTIQLSPSVDVQMWTQKEGSSGRPMFSLQSIGFDPNVELLPGVGMSASSLGIEIEVVGELRPTPDGKGVAGSVAFATKGKLPPPLLLLPDAPLRLASNTINDTIVKFAVESFQKGAIQKYKEFKATKICSK